MRSTYITAIVIAVLTALWLASGQLGDDQAVAEHPTLSQLNSENKASLEDVEPTRVRARAMQATERTARVRLRGRTENKRTVEVRVETMGRIVERPVERGTRVEQGNLICRIAVDDRKAKLNRAAEAVNQARIEFEGSKRLQTRGFQSETAIATARAKLAAAQADLEGSKIDLERVSVRAPFGGVVEQTHAEIGDYLQPGSACATIVDLDPMLLVADVSERQVGRLRIGIEATGRLASGAIVAGPISFIGKQADAATRTYRVDIEVANPDFAISSGITTQIEVPVATVLAHKISPALFALDDAGGIGVRTISDANRVEFHLVTIVEDDTDGVWVTGLPATTVLITVGQELVVPGETVSIDFEPAGEMPAARPDATQSNQAGSRLREPRDTTSTVAEAS